jgi:hypothetical protein
MLYILAMSADTVVGRKNERKKEGKKQEILMSASYKEERSYAPPTTVSTPTSAPCLGPSNPALGPLHQGVLWFLGRTCDDFASHLFESLSLHRSIVQQPVHYELACDVSVFANLSDTRR